MAILFYILKKTKHNNSMQVIVTFLIVSLILLIFLSFITCRVIFYDNRLEVIIFNLKIMTLKEKSYAYIVYLITKHLKKKKKKKKKTKISINLVKVRTSICIHLKHINEIEYLLFNEILILFNQLYPIGIRFDKVKFNILLSKEYALDISIKLLI